MRPILADAFEHHVWATLRLIDACGELSPDQLERPVAGTYGSILATLRHLVGADRSYLSLLSEGQVEDADTDASDVAALRDLVRQHAEAWSRVVEGDLDPDRLVIRQRDDGSESHAPLGIRLAQVLHHGSDHRSQVCTGITLLGLEPPAIDAWDYADQQGRLREVPAPRGSAS